MSENDPGLLATARGFLSSPWTGGPRLIAVETRSTWNAADDTSHAAEDLIGSIYTRCRIGSVVQGI